MKMKSQLGANLPTALKDFAEAAKAKGRGVYGLQ
jgi:hypothetical protein